MKTFDIYERTFNFSVEIIRFVNSLPKERVTFTLGDQLIRSSCSIGANLREAKQARTKKEFISGFGIAIRECEEAKYWLELIKNTIDSSQKCVNLIDESTEILKILTSIVKKAKT